MRITQVTTTVRITSSRRLNSKSKIKVKLQRIWIGQLSDVGAVLLIGGAFECIGLFLCTNSGLRLAGPFTRSKKCHIATSNLQSQMGAGDKPNAFSDNYIVNDIAADIS